MRPWAPPMILVGGKKMMTHGVMGGDNPQAELFTVENETMTSIGFLRPGQPFEIEGNTLSLGSVKRYTGMQV